MDRRAYLILAVTTFAAVLATRVHRSWAACDASPSPTCRSVGKSSLSIADQTDDSRDKLLLKLQNAASTSFAELGDPTTGTAYELCLYADDALLAEIALPGGSLCDGSPCWTVKGDGSGYRYKDRDGQRGGIVRAVLQASSSAKTSALVRGAGEALPDLSLPLSEPVTAQLRNATTGLCFSTTYEGDDVTTNDATSGKFKAKATGQATSFPHDAFYNVTSLSYDGDDVVIRTKDLPDHGSPFYATSNPLYEPYDGPNPSFSTAINLMGQISDPDLAEQDITFRIPRNPTPAAFHQATGFGPIGIALNGVVLFNQYNGMGALLDTLELNNMDQYNGHPTPAPSLQYHYHLEPLWLTATLGSGALVGYLLDGFPVYGPVENGSRLTSADLDDYHGHTHATSEYAAGIYHYHFTDDAPWMNGDGYYGTPGTVTR